MRWRRADEERRERSVLLAQLGWRAFDAPLDRPRRARGGHREWSDAGRRTTAGGHRLRRGGAREGVEEAAKSPPIVGVVASGRPFLKTLHKGPCHTNKGGCY